MTSIKPRTNDTTPLAALCVGGSFAEASCFSEGKNLGARFFYLPQESLGSSLKKFFSEISFSPKKILISSQYLEKIFDTKLGGSVAQLTTKGFEHWLYLRQPLQQAGFETVLSRQEPLGSQELVFSVSERISADGTVLETLKIDELEAIASKLRLADVKKVCVNFLFAHKNPEHQDRAVSFFREQGFDVFFPSQSLTQDEAAQWRRSVFNACLAGTFEDFKKDLSTHLPDCQLLFLKSNGEFAEIDSNEIVDTLFGIQKILSHKNSHVLHLGLENWFVISPEMKALWQSPWGSISTRLPTFHKTFLQPTLELTSDSFGGLSFSRKELGYEPGPVAFGRALRPTLFDCLHQLMRLELAQISANSDKRWKEIFTTLAKSTPQMSGLTEEKMLKSLLEYLTVSLLQEVPVAKDIVVTGYFTPYLLPVIKSAAQKKGLKIRFESGELSLSTLLKTQWDQPETVKPTGALK